MRQRLAGAHEEYQKVEKERDELFKSFEEGIQRVKQQSDFQNEGIEQRIQSAERAANLASFQVEELMKNAGLNAMDMEGVMGSLSAILLSKDEALKKARYDVARMKKAYNDTYQTLIARINHLGIPESEMQDLGFALVDYAVGSTDAPAGLVSFS